MMRSAMKTPTLSRLALGVALGALLLHPGAADAQEGDCRLEPNPAVETAQAAIRQAQDAASPEQAEPKWREALSALRGRLDGDDAAALLLAARAHIGLWNYDEAARLLDRFVLLAPECGEPANNMRFNAWVDAYNQAISAYQEGDEDRALQNFETANLIYDDARSFNNAALLYREKGETDKAMEMYRKAVETGGDEEQMRGAIENLTGLLAEQGRDEEALTVCERYMEEHPDDQLVRVKCAVVLARSGRVEQARPILEEVLAGDDLSGDEWNWVGVDLFNAEEYEKSADAFRRAYEKKPYDKDALENLVTALVQVERHEEAVSAAETLVERYPYDAVNYQLLASSLANTNRGREALGKLQESEGLPVLLESLRLTSSGEGVYLIRGVARGQGRGGVSLTIPFELVGPDGSVLGTEDLTLTAPAEGESREFDVTIRAEGEVAGFRYRKAGGQG